MPIARALVIDGGWRDLQTCDRVLSTCGLAVSLVRTLEEGARRLRILRPHLLLIDPGAFADGMGFLRAVTQLPPGERPKVCVISAKCDRESVMTALGTGIDGYLIKPLSPDKLIAKTRKILGLDLEGNQVYHLRSRFRCEMADGVLKPHMTVIEMSERDIVLLSSADFEVGSVVRLRCPALSRLAELPEAFPCQVLSCRRQSAAWSHVQAEFVGLAEPTVARMRAAAIRGQFLSDEVLHLPTRGLSLEFRS